MITREDIKRRLREAIVDNIPELGGRHIEEDTPLSEHEEVDSLSFIMVLSDLEEKLGVTVPDEEWDGLRTFGDVVNAFAKRLHIHHKTV